MRNPCARICCALLMSALSGAAFAQDPHAFIGTETVETRFGNFEFKGGFPTADTVTRLYEMRTFNRAVEAYLSQVAAVSMFYQRKGLNEFGVDAANTFAISETLNGPKQLFLTSNTETVYGTSFFDLKRDGPLVVVAPPKMYGGGLDMWQRSVEEIGPAGPDKGQGGKFLFLPPGYSGDVPSGYFVVRSPTFGMWFVVRGFLVDGRPDQAITLMKTVKIYPLAQAANPPPMTFLDLSARPIDTVFPDTFAFFESLASVVESEPVDAVAPSDRFLLASIGIEKGKPFNPDANSKRLLEEAARAGAAMARANTFASRNPESRVYPERQWEWAFLGGSYTWDAKGYVDYDESASWFYQATGSSPAMVNKAVGVGSQYIWTPRDAKGAFLDGGKSYRLHLPPNIPAKQFWSVIVYDALSRSELENGQPFPSINSYANPTSNADGSIDIYFGPDAPAGKDKNWIRTVPGKGWFTWMRFYSPTEPFFDKTWKPDDIVEVK